MRQTSQFLNAIEQISVRFEPFETLEPRGGSIAANFELVSLVFEVIYFGLKSVSTIFFLLKSQNSSEFFVQTNSGNFKTLV